MLKLASLQFCILRSLLKQIIFQSVLTGSLVSFVVLSWICIKAQLALMQGEIRYPKMPVSVSGCDYAYDNATVWSTLHGYR